VQFNGSTEFAAGRSEVWQALIDPTRIGACSPIPINRVDETHFASQTTIGSGLFSAVFKVQVELIVEDPQQLARLVARGQGSGTTVDGTMSFALSDGPAADTTVVDWAAEVQLGGMFASMGTKMIEQRAPVAIESLIECLHRQIEV
jgi:carbon monoxide dehydrogenase subunit G